MRSRDNGLAPAAMITLSVTSLYCSIAIIAMAFVKDNGKAAFVRSRDNGLAPAAMITLSVTSLYCSIAIIAMAFVKDNGKAAFVRSRDNNGKRAIAPVMIMITDNDTGPL